MARLVITPTVVPNNAPAVVPKTVLVVADGVAIPAGRESRPIMITVKNATAGPATVTVRGGVYLGVPGKDLVLTIPANTESILAPLDSIRSKQSDGYFWIDSDVIVSVSAFRRP
jgi:hypothetical protein